MKTSIKIKKFWYADPVDGGMGIDFKEIVSGQRENTVQFQGSEADTTNYKNELGQVLQSATSKGDKTLNFQLADLTPEIVADFTGGTASSSTEADSYDAPVNENQYIEKSVMFLTDENVLFRLPRVKFDGFPMINSDDLHYNQISGVVLLPEDGVTTSYGYDIMKVLNNALITSFSLDEETGAATIDDSAETVDIEVESGTDVTTLQPHVGVSKGASVSPLSGVITDFTSPVEYTVTAIDGTTKTYTVTVTVAA